MCYYDIIAVGEVNYGNLKDFVDFLTISSSVLEVGYVPTVQQQENSESPASCSKTRFI